MLLLQAASRRQRLCLQSPCKYLARYHGPNTSNSLLQRKCVMGDTQTKPPRFNASSVICKENFVNQAVVSLCRPFLETCLATERALQTMSLCEYVSKNSP